MRHYSEFQANPQATLRAADLEPAELGFFDRANLRRCSWKRGPPLATAAPGIQLELSLLLPTELLSFVDSTPRAYQLKAGNAARNVSTGAVTSPILCLRGLLLPRRRREANPHVAVT
jgi:hypothetical protein